MGLAQWSCARRLTRASPHWGAESVETAFEKRNGTGFTGDVFLTSTLFGQTRDTGAYTRSYSGTSADGLRRNQPQVSKRNEFPPAGVGISNTHARRTAMLISERRALVTEIQDRLIELYVQQDEARRTEDRDRERELQVEIDKATAQREEIRR
jgi:hypothetical protein